MTDAYGIPELVADLRAITAEVADEGEIIRRVQPLVRKAADRRAWLDEAHYTCDEEQGFGVHLLHEEEDHTLAVFAIAWLAGRGIAAHNHGTWAVVVGVDGDEHNINWERRDDGSRDGYAEIAVRNEVVVGHGDLISFRPDDIHSVENRGDVTTLSLHVYGKHINFTGRYQYDPATNRAERLILKLE
jgi:predicted metal-dependent enzyme (double-stranded beta helix superfamily)